MKMFCNKIIFKKTRLYTKFISQMSTKYISSHARYEGLLRVINTSKPEDLSSYCLSPFMVQKILEEREIAGDFKSLSDLNLTGIAGEKMSVLNKIVMKEELSMEELQSIIASYSSSSKYGNELQTSEEMVGEIESKKSSSKSYKKKKISDKILSSLTIPCYENYRLKEINSITAISLSVSEMGWTVLDINGMVQDISAAPLFTNLTVKGLQAMDLHDLYDKVLLARRQLPESDLYIIEKDATSRIYSAEASLFSMVKYMFLPLLDQREIDADLHPLIFLKNKVVSRLYDLQVGTERKSGVESGESILACKTSLPWMPSISFSTMSLQKYILSTYSERIQMTDSLLLALAFYSVVIKKDDQSLMLL